MEGGGGGGEGTYPKMQKRKQRIKENVGDEICTLVK